MGISVITTIMRRLGNNNEEGELNLTEIMT